MVFAQPQIPTVVAPLCVVPIRFRRYVTTLTGELEALYIVATNDARSLVRYDSV